VASETEAREITPHASRSTPHAPRTAVRQTSGVRSCAGPSPLATAIHRQPDCQRPNGARSRRSASLFSMSPSQAILEEKPIRFLPTRRRSTVHDSLVAGGDRGQWLHVCLQVGYQPRCLSLYVAARGLSFVDSGANDTPKCSASGARTGDFFFAGERALKPVRSLGHSAVLG
jgi:hypothetical protein